MSEETVPVWQHHSIVSMVTQDDERVRGCTCQVAQEEVDITEGKVSHLAEKENGCPHRDE